MWAEHLCHRHDRSVLGVNKTLPRGLHTARQRLTIYLTYIYLAHLGVHLGYNQAAPEVRWRP